LGRPRPDYLRFQLGGGEVALPGLRLRHRQLFAGVVKRPGVGVAVADRGDRLIEGGVGGREVLLGEAASPSAACRAAGAAVSVVVMDGTSRGAGAGRCAETGVASPHAITVHLLSMPRSSSVAGAPARLSKRLASREHWSALHPQTK
jgi:hypothetical protein